MAINDLQWAAFELRRRRDRAQTPEDRAAVNAEIARARTDADFRARLAQIAQHGRFQSGGWGAAQLGLAAATMAPYLPVVGSALGPVGTGIGTAAALGLGGIGAANIAEGLQRRSEGLPGTTMQMGLGAADVGLPFLGPASRLLRGLRGAKLPPPAFKRGTTYTIGPVAPEGPGARFQGQRWTPTSHPGRSAAGVPKPQYTAGTAGATGLARTALQKELDELLPTTLEEGVRARRGGTVGRPDPYIGDPRVPGQGFQPEVTYRGGELPNITRPMEGYEGLPASLAAELRARGARNAALVGGRLATTGRRLVPDPTKGLQTALQERLDRVLPTTLGGPEARVGGTVGKPGPYIADPRVPAQGFQPEVRYSGQPNPPLGGVGIADAGRAASTGARMGAMPPPAFKRGLTYTGRGPVEGVGPYLGPGRGPMSQFGRPIGPGAGGRGGGGTTATPTATPTVTPAVTPTPTGTVPMGIGAAVVAARAGLTPARRTSLDPALQWLQEGLEKTVTSDVTADLLMARGIGGAESAKLLARGTRGAPVGGIKQYRPLEVAGSREMPASAKTMKGRRPPGPRFAEEVTLTNTRRSAEAFNATLAKAERAAAVDELMTSNSFQNARQRLGLGEGLGVPGKKSPLYTDYVLSVSALGMKNRAQGAMKVLTEMGLLTTEQAARLEDLVTEGYMRTHHGFATTGRRTEDLAGMVPVKGKAGRPMGKDLVDYINSIQGLLASLGVLFAGIFTAEQLMPQGGVNAAAG